MLMPMIWSDTDDRDEFRHEMMEMEKEMNRFFNGDHVSHAPSFKTDVIDEGADYKLKADLPGFQKDDIHLDLKDGNLVISAQHKTNNDEKNEKGEYIRRERSVSSFTRSFYVGKDVKPEDVHAAYDNGVLSVTVPKKQAVEAPDAATRIAIE